MTDTKQIERFDLCSPFTFSNMQRNITWLAGGDAKPRDDEVRLAYIWGLYHQLRAMGYWPMFVEIQVYQPKTGVSSKVLAIVKSGVAASLPLRQRIRSSLRYDLLVVEGEYRVPIGRHIADPDHTGVGPEVLVLRLPSKLPGVVFCLPIRPHSEVLVSNEPDSEAEIKAALIRSGVEPNPGPKNEKATVAPVAQEMADFRDEQQRSDWHSKKKRCDRKDRMKRESAAAREFKSRGYRGRDADRSHVETCAKERRLKTQSDHAPQIEVTAETRADLGLAASHGPRQLPWNRSGEGTRPARRDELSKEGVEKNPGPAGKSKEKQPFLAERSLVKMHVVKAGGITWCKKCEVGISGKHDHKRDVEAYVVADVSSKTNSSTQTVEADKVLVCVCPRKYVQAITRMIASEERARRATAEDAAARPLLEGPGLFGNVGFERRQVYLDDVQLLATDFEDAAPACEAVLETDRPTTGESHCVSRRASFEAVPAMDRTVTACTSTEGDLSAPSAPTLEVLVDLRVPTGQTAAPSAQAPPQKVPVPVIYESDSDGEDEEDDRMVAESHFEHKPGDIPGEACKSCGRYCTLCPCRGPEVPVGPMGFKETYDRAQPAERKTLTGPVETVHEDRKEPEADAPAEDGPRLESEPWWALFLRGSQTTVTTLVVKPATRDLRVISGRHVTPIMRPVVIQLLTKTTAASWKSTLAIIFMLFCAWHVIPMGPAVGASLIRGVSTAKCVAAGERNIRVMPGAGLFFSLYTIYNHFATAKVAAANETTPPGVHSFRMVGIDMQVVTTATGNCLNVWGVQMCKDRVTTCGSKLDQTAQQWEQLERLDLVVIAVSWAARLMMWMYPFAMIHIVRCWLFHKTMNYTNCPSLMAAVINETSLDTAEQGLQDAIRNGGSVVSRLTTLMLSPATTASIKHSLPFCMDMMNKQAMRQGFTYRAALPVQEYSGIIVVVT